MLSRRRVVATLLLALLCVASTRARADTVSTFSFAGECVDCSGVGAATLVLSDYTIGTPISANNFVSFAYDGTDLLPAFTIAATDSFFIDGIIANPLPGQETVDIYGNSEAFSSTSSGFWCVGGGCFADYGTTHVWSVADATSDVPEPMTIVLLGSGLIGLAAVRVKS